MAESPQRQKILLLILGVLILVTAWVVLKDRLFGSKSASTASSDVASTVTPGLTAQENLSFSLELFQRPDFILLDPDQRVFYLTPTIASVRKGVPKPPLALRSTDMTIGGAIILTWKYPDDTTVDRAVIYRSGSAQELGEKLVDVPRNGGSIWSTSYVDRRTETHEVEDGTPYFYTIRTVNAAGTESSNTQPVLGISTDKTPPKTPQNVKVSETEQGILQLQWTPPTDDAKTFDIYRSTSSTSLGELVLADVDPQLGEVEDIQVIAEIEYYYTVIAKDAAGNTSTSVLLSSHGRENPFEPFVIE